MRKVLTYILLLTSLMVWSQNGTGVATDFPYECSFEEGEDLTPWMLNDGTSTAKDQWMFGTAVHSEGRRSMYVSADGLNPNYEKSPNVVVSYLRYQMPQATTAQNYDVSFDWKGVGDSTTSKLYLMICPEYMLTDATTDFYIGNITSTTSGLLSNTISQQCVILEGSDANDPYLCGSETWQNVSLPLTTPLKVPRRDAGEVYTFVFIWVNSNMTDSLNKSSIAIDNFQINTANIQKPTNLVVYPVCEDSTLLVTWQSGLPEFDIYYRKTGIETVWTHGASGITEGEGGFTKEDGKCTYSFPDVLEGTYDVRIRGKYTDDEGVLWTNYVYASNILMYCPDNHCVNYLNFYSPNVECRYGFHPNAQPGATPYDSIGIIDYGPDSQESRHTLHVDPTETDPRTENQLHTIPDGALASVRLGNWQWGGEAEAITYDIFVDTTTQGILIVKYAVVFENPQGHPPEDEPAFKLEILKPSGELIDDLCGQASFTYSDAENDPEHWHLTSDESVAWKDWTVVGVSLMDFHNQNIKVRFTTLDCGWSGHFAYAYFILDCANAHIETENCGGDASIECVAPEGFAYYWYKNDDINDPAENPYSQTLLVEASRTKYTCRVSFIEEPSCFFEISTTSEPRFPVPEYTFTPDYSNCESKLVFTNTSHVMTMVDGVENHTSEKCNRTSWRFHSQVTGYTRETDQWSPTYKCLSTGDIIEVTCTSYIGAADDPCDSTSVFLIITPNIVSENSVLYKTTCFDTPIQFGEDWFPDRDGFPTDTTIVRSFTNFAGCDSTSTLHLKVYPKAEDQYRHDSICSNQSVVINGMKFNKPLDNYPIRMKTVNGCDSMLFLTLTVNQLLHAQIDSFAYVCADEGPMQIKFSINDEALFDSLEIKFSTPQLRDTVIYDQVTEVYIPYPADILPGHYMATMIFHQFCCGETTEVHKFDIRYSSSIVEQKWNDVLTVLSPKYNGGYEFLSFQWYKNDQPIAGETHSYLYQPLDFDATYYVEVMGTDSVVMKTCPIQPVYHEQQTAYPTIVKAGQRIQLYMEQAATIWYYTVSGQLYGSLTLPQGYASLQTPNQPGVYVLKAIRSDGETQAQVMIVQQ